MAALVAATAMTLHAISTLSIAILVFVMLGALVSTIITRILIGHYALQHGWAAATTLHGRFFVGLISSLAAGFVACCRYGVFTHPVPFEGVVVVGLKVMLSQFYRHVQAFHWHHRLIIASCIVTCFLSCPATRGQTWSVLGWHSEVALMTSCLCLGELLGFCVTGASVNARLEERARAAEAHRMADSRLNHLIKGHCGGTLTSLALYSQMLPPEVGDRLPQDLRLLLAKCDRHMSAVIFWCHRRQTFLRMEQGTYESHRLPVNLVELLASIALGGRERVWVCPRSQHVGVDEFVLRACLEEALANARTHSAPDTTIQLSARLVQDPRAHSPGSTADGGLRLLVSVENANEVGVPALTNEQCTQAFRPGYTSGASASESTSDGLGLETVAMLVQSAGGRVWLEGRSAHGRPASSSNIASTTFHLSLPARFLDAELPPAAEADTPRDVTAMLGPAPALSVTPPSYPESTGTGASSRSSSSPTSFVGHASLPPAWHAGARGDGPSGRGAPPPNALPRLKCVAIDDDELQRELHRSILKHCFMAEPAESCVVGSTSAEHDAFVGICMGTLDAKLQPVRRSDQRQADVAIVDHRMQWPDEKPAADDAAAARGLVLGTDLAFKLQEAGFRGVVCMVTAESGQDAAELARMPGVDAVYEKGMVSPRLLAQNVRELLKTKQQGMGK